MTESIQPLRAQARQFAQGKTRLRELLEERRPAMGRAPHHMSGASGRIDAQTD
jgi:hypothetical protein